MYIVSKFKDYYDVLPNEKGDLPKYIRTTKPHEIGDRWKKERATKSKEEAQRVRDFYRHVAHLQGRHHRMPAHPGWDAKWGYKRYDTGLVVFCGQAYPFYWIDGQACYNIEQVIKVYEELAKKDWGTKNHKDVLAMLRSDKVDKWKRYGGSVKLTRGNWEKFLEDRENEFKAYTTVNADTHLYFNAPIIYVGSGTNLGLGYPNVVMANPCLNKLNFAGQVDPYSAYQELDMFLANTFTTAESPDLVMDEKLKVHSKGMDKWSFRTMPGDSPKTKKKRLKKQMKVMEDK